MSQRFIDQLVIRYQNARRNKNKTEGEKGLRVANKGKIQAQG